MYLNYVSLSVNVPKGLKHQHEPRMNSLRL